MILQPPHTVIAEKAHEIWELEGRPDGQAERHWREAELLLTPQPAGASPKAASAPPTKPTEPKK